MKKHLLFIFLIGLTILKTNAQDINTFKRELSSLQYQYSQLFASSNTVEQLESRADNINHKVSMLSSQAKDHVRKEKLSREPEWKSLIDEIEEFESFTRFGRPVCECLSYFNQFMRGLNSSKRIISEHQGLRVIEASIGNFKLYYIYGQYDWHYDLKVTMSSNQKYGKKRIEMSFGLWGGAEILLFAPENQIWSLRSIELLGTTQDIYRTIKCHELIPRF